MTRLISLSLLILSALLVFTGCTKVNENNTPTAAPAAAVYPDLNREKVLNLITRQIAPKEVFAHMSTSSSSLEDLTSVYTQMIAEKTISCIKVGEHFERCRPTPDSEIYLRLAEPEGGNIVAGSLRVKIGWKTPTEVTGISKVSDTTAIADYLVTYEPIPDIPFFPKYEKAFSSIDNRQNENHRAYLRKFDSGWKIERLV